MARKQLEKRGNAWRIKNAARDHIEEDTFLAIMTQYLQDTDFTIGHRPLDLAKIYGSSGQSNRHGIRPMFKIRNQTTNKSVFVDLKRQKAGGNAHERACKYFMPGIIKSARKIANHHPNPPNHPSRPKRVIPFWIVLAGEIAGDPRHRQKIAHWFQGFERNLLLWPDVNDSDAVTGHFEEHIRPMLEE